MGRTVKSAYAAAEYGAKLVARRVASRPPDQVAVCYERATMTYASETERIAMTTKRSTPTEVHRTTVEASVAAIAAFLQDVLGQKLVAYMAGVSDPKTVGRWAKGDREPRGAAEHRLREAYTIFQLLQTKESPHTVRAWFVGLNPQLDDESPAKAMSEGRTRDALVAAKSFLAGG